MKHHNYFETLTEREGSDLASYSAVQLLFLKRLSDLLQLRHDCSKLIAGDNWRMRLLNKSLYSTFRDCAEQGVEIEATALFDIERESADRE